MESSIAYQQTKSKRKLSKTEKEIKMQKQRQKLSEMIDSFYEKSRHKIQKSLNKENKRVALLYKQLLQELSQQPKQELFEISRINDEIFNEMNKLNTAISDFLKVFENLKERVSREIEIQKGKNEVREQKEKMGEYDIAVLRKINFKKEKTCLTHKLKDIDCLNKKLVKFECQSEGEKTGGIEIDGKRVEGNIHKYKKIWFESKKKEYLLCLTSKQNERSGNLILFNDKLQVITQFSHLPAISIQTFREVVQIKNCLYLIHSHQVIKIDLTNELEYSSQVFRQRINRAQQFEGGLILWMEDEHSNHYLLFLTNQLQIYFQNYLRINIRSIGVHFKLRGSNQQEELYFVGRTSTGNADLFKINDTEISLVCKDIGPIDEVVECKAEGKVRCVLFRRNGELFKFTSAGVSEKLFHIDIQNGESMQKCCILGQHFYALHQSGKSLLECHFKMGRADLNPQP